MVQLTQHDRSRGGSVQQGFPAAIDVFALCCFSDELAELGPDPLLSGDAFAFEPQGIDLIV